MVLKKLLFLLFILSGQAFSQSSIKSIHQEVINSYKENGNADDLPDHIPKKLLKFYYRKLISQAKKYRKNPSYSEAAASLDFIKQSISMYSEILIEVEYKEEKVEKLLALIEQLEQSKKDSLYYGNFFVGLGYVTWKDIVTLVSSTGERSEIKSTMEGFNFCTGLKRENAYLLYKLGLCYASGQAAVGNKTQTFSYFQESVPITMYSMVPSVLWKPYKGDTAIGLSIPVAYRTGDFTAPTNFTLENTELLTYGYLVNFIWFWGSISVELQVGKLQKFSSSYWSLSTIYSF